MEEIMVEARSEEDADPSRRARSEAQHQLQDRSGDRGYRLPRIQIIPEIHPSKEEGEEQPQDCNEDS